MMNGLPATPNNLTHVLRIFINGDVHRSIIGRLFALRLEVDHAQDNWARVPDLSELKRVSPDELKVTLLDGQHVRFVIEENN